MKAIYIYPEDIGASGPWSEKWLKFIRKFGWQDDMTRWDFVLVVRIDID